MTLELSYLDTPPLPLSPPYLLSYPKLPPGPPGDPPPPPPPPPPSGACSPPIAPSVTVTGPGLAYKGLSIPVGPAGERLGVGAL